MEYPDDKRIRQEIDMILDKGLPCRKSRSERLREIFIGPGIPVIFYRAKLIFCGSFLLYLLLAWFCYMAGSRAACGEYMILMMYPLLQMIFHGLSCWAEEQYEIVELKMSMHYSFSYIVGLRVFYVSMFSAAFNFVLTGLILKEPYWMKLCAAGLSSTFLFAAAALVLHEWFQRSRFLWGMVFVWAVLCMILSQCGERVSFFVFDVMPLAVHMLIAAASFGIFIYHIGKDGREYAYTFEYQ